MPKPTQPLRPEALKELIQTSGVKFNDKNRKSYIFDCPKCGRDERLYIRRYDGRFVCWYCRDKEGFEGAPEFALTLLLGRSIEDIRTILYGPDFTATSRLDFEYTYSARRYVDATDDREEDEMELFGVEEKKLVAIPYPPTYHPIDDPKSAPGLAYLQGRGISAEVALRYQLQYDTAKRRVVFPVVTRGVLVGWQARCCGPSEWVDDEGRPHKMPKILTTIADGMRDHVLMFEHRLEGSRHAVLTEGPVDAIKADLCGGNVCSMGKSVSSGQVERLKAYGIKRLYLAQDPDASTETSLLNKRYHDDFEMYYMTPQGTGYEDFGAMSPEQVLERFKAAEKAHARRLFLWFGP